MVVNLQVGTWLGFKLDKKATREVVEQNNAQDGTARVNKHIVPKEALAKVVSASNAIRTHFYEKTLPWKDNGDRLLNNKLFESFIQEHSKLKHAFMNEVDHFIESTYPTVLDAACFRMGALFNQNDYPRASEIKPKFYANLDMDPVTLPEGLKGIVDGKREYEIIADAEAVMSKRLKTAMTDVWTRLSTTLTHFADKMGSDAIFRDSTIRNLEDIVEMLPALNIMNDPDLAQLGIDINASLLSYTPKDLRQDKAQRAEAAAEAKRIMQDMGGFMKVFGVEQ